MSDSDAVLFANEAFYRAFVDRDLAAMEAVWSREAQVSCIHPGWAPLFGRDEVMTSWAAIVSAPGAPDISCRGARAQVYGATARSEEHTSELQSLMRISYAVFCLKKKTTINHDS